MASKKPVTKNERSSPGTIMAERNRDRMNQLGDTRREALFAKGMSLIYGRVRPAKAAARSR